MQTQKQQQKQRAPHSSGMLHDWLWSNRPDKEASSRDTTHSTWNAWNLIRGACFFLIAWVLTYTPLLFSVNPLNLALLCATEQHVLWILGGILFGIWQHSAHAWLYAGSAILAIVLRLFARLFLTPEREGEELPPHALRTLYFQRRWSQLRQICQRGGTQSRPSEQPSPSSDAVPLPPMFDEPIRLRVMVALISALIPCLGIPIQGDFAYYDLYGAVFYLLLLPLATWLFCFALHTGSSAVGKMTDREQLLPVWYHIGTTLLFLSVCFCGRSITFLGLSPVICLTVLLSLYAIHRYGLGGGVYVGLLGSIAYDVRTIPLFLAIAVLYALLHPIVGSFSLFPSLLAALLYTLLGGGSSMFWATVPSLAVGMLLFSVLGRLRQYWNDEKEKQHIEHYRQDATMQQLVCEQNRNNALCHRISAVAGSFGSLSEVFRQLGETLSHPSAGEIHHLCDEVYDDYCPDCPNKNRCWSDEYSDTVSGIHTISRVLVNERGLKQEHFPEALRQRCPYTPSILSDINYRVARRTAERLQGADNKIFAQSYDVIAHLLRDILREDTQDSDPFSCAQDLSESVACYLGEHNIYPRLVCVTGERRKTVQIFGLTPAALTLSKQEFRQDLGKLCGARMSRIRYDGSDDGTITLHTLPKLRADYVHRSVAATESAPVRQAKRTVCGDTLRLFEGEDGMFYALLCDGMGSGRNAALTSGSCAVFLERVLRTGVSVHTALRMLNQYLLSRSTSPEDECSSTIDLFALDLYTGKARFIKSGAAPSLILRDGRLFRLSSHTVPIGILHAIDAQVIPFDVKPGDHILMMSDGITDTSLDAQEQTSDGEMETRAADDWLTEYLSDDTHIPTPQQSEDPASEDGAWIDTLFRMARTHGSTDDISMISIRISTEQDESTLSNDPTK